MGLFLLFLLLALIKGKSCRDPEDKGIHGYQPKSKAKPRKDLKILPEDKACPISEGFQIDFFYEY